MESNGQQPSQRSVASMIGTVFLGIAALLCLATGLGAVAAWTARMFEVVWNWLH